jgi:hypothetical protein
VYFILSINTGANTVQLTENPYDTVALTPTSSAAYNASFSGYPSLDVFASAGNAVNNSDFGHIDAEAYGNVCAVSFANVSNCKGHLAEVMTSATGTALVARNAGIGLTTAGSSTLTQDQSANYGYCNVTNLAGGPVVYNGGSFTLDSSYQSRTLRYTGTSDITITVPNNLPKGFDFSITPTGATGIVTFVASSGGAVFSKSGLRTNGQYATARLENIGNKVFRLTGDLQV